MLTRPKLIDSKNVEHRVIPHILKVPQQSVSFPRNDKVNVGEILQATEEHSDYISDHLRMVPMASNGAGSSISYGLNMYSNTNLSQRAGARLASAGLYREPMYTPPGGIQYIHEAKSFQEDLYDMANLKRPYVPFSITPEWGFGSTVPRNDFQFDQVKVQASLIPNMVYDIEQVPEMGSPERMIVLRPSVSAMGLPSMPFAEIDRNSQQLTKYINNRDMIAYLPPVFSTVVKIDNENIPIQIRTKSPLEIAILAQAGAPIEIPTPDAGIIKLKDYQWSIHQANLTSPAQLVLEVKMGLKEKEDLSHALNSIIVEPTYREANVPDARELRQSHPDMALSGFESNQKEIVRSEVELNDSRQYSSLTTGFQFIPESGQLEPSQVRFDRRGKMSYQPVPIVSYPWV